MMNIDRKLARLLVVFSVAAVVVVGLALPAAARTVHFKASAAALKSACDKSGGDSSLSGGTTTICIMPSGISASCGTKTDKNGNNCTGNGISRKVPKKVLQVLSVLLATTAKAPSGDSGEPTTSQPTTGGTAGTAPGSTNTTTTTTPTTTTTGPAFL